MSAPDLARAAALLAAARRGGAKLVELPASVRPTTWAEAYAVQDDVVRGGGPVIGWKVGARTPGDEPFRGALNADTVSVSPARLAGDRFNVIGVEGELVYRMATSLPPRDAPMPATRSSRPSPPFMPPSRSSTRAISPSAPSTS